MYKADVYLKNNNLQQNDIQKVLRNSFDLIKWNRNGEDTVLDLGCGCGDKTKEWLIPLFPDFKQIIGIDLSKEMLEYAREHNSHEKIRYVQMDAADSQQIPNEMKNAIDHAFSFHVLHWIKNQEQLFNNLFTMLKSGGDMLSFFVATTTIMSVYERIAKIPKWTNYMLGVNNIFPYQHSDDALQDIEVVLKQAGFAHMVKFEQRQFVYSSRQDFNVSMGVINPFIKNIPEEYHDEYIKDFERIAEQFNMFVEHPTHGEIAVVPYTLAVLYIRKPDVAQAG